MDSLRHLAVELSIPERTLRRAVADGLVHGRRVSPRRFHAPLREESYLRSHWKLLSELRSALRTEPNIELAVLFGSTAVGSDHERSDIDILVVMRKTDMARVADLAQRLTDRLGREIQPVRLHDAERSPTLMASILKQGRVLVDRERRWSALKATEPKWQSKARRTERSFSEAMQSLELDEMAL
jgi:predicted nucleotidyltransferase